MATKNILVLQNITKKFGKTSVLNNITLEIRRNEILGLIGFSGSGKTTLLRTLIGYYKINSGKILFNDQDFTRKLDKLRENIGFGTQENSFYDRLTVEENIKYFASLNKLKRKEVMVRMEKLLELMRLKNAKKKKAKDISGGMKKRLDLAISLIHDPEILILDEPTSGLDPILTHEIYELLRLIRDVDKTIIIASHNYDMLERYADRIAILSESRIIDCDKPAELIRKYKAKDLIDVFRKIGVISV